MNYHVLEARYVTGHVIWLRFRDGTTGEIDLASVLDGPVFEPLRDPAVFRQFRFTLNSTRWSGRTAPTSRLNFCTTTCESRHNIRMEPTQGDPLTRPALSPRSVDRGSLGAAHPDR